MADMFEAATQTGEMISLVLVTLAFLLFLFLAARTRTGSSLQVQMFVVVLVLFVAEAPKILWTLGIADFSGLEVVGLEVHSLSMVLLSGFLAWKIYGFLKGSKE